MKSTAEKLLVNGAKVLGWAFAGAVIAWCLFYVADFVLLRTTSINLYHQGELLMDSIHKPTDPLVPGYLLYFWLSAIGAMIGVIFGMVRIVKQK